MQHYAFLIRSDADVEALLEAHLHAIQWGVPFLAALFAAGHFTAEYYAAALAADAGIPFAPDGIILPRPMAGAAYDNPFCAIATPFTGLCRGAPALIVCATDATPDVVRDRIAEARRQTRRSARAVVLVTGAALSEAQEQAHSGALLKAATYGLKRHAPHFSAGRGGPVWQSVLLLMMPGLLAGGLMIDQRNTFALLTVLLTLPFAGTVLVRMAALAGLFRSTEAARRPPARTSDRDLPVYSILVALYDEAEVLPTLIAALSRLDYPAAKLDCLLVIEDVDAATKLAILKCALPPWMRVIIVPDGALRTKPRALNYALKLARGDYVVIYDAEDRPEPDQLRRAYAAFKSGGASLGCVQACLNVFNARQSWLTRQFTVEYSSLFDAVLPALQRLGLPMPLGGTSNHFPRALLEEMHGWDPYNVTEDADLGIRIARLRRRIAMIPSTTWEEAPASFRLWLRQRTRWLKGWMQTYLVHTRQPLQLIRDLGFFRTLGFHLYLGGLILSALVHPFFYAAVIADYFFDLRPEGFDSPFGQAMWLAAVANLAAGYLTSIIVGVVSVRRRGHRLTFSALLMPFYWLLISLAAYRAVWQLYRDPYLWEKTPHGLAEED